MESLGIEFNNILTQAQTPISPFEFIFMLVLTAITSYMVKITYVKYGSAISNRRGFGKIFIPIAMTTMIIITVVKSSLALSLGLVGALSIVRFRAAIKEPEELVYLFICIAIGLGFGANQILVTILGVFALILFIVLTKQSMNKEESENVMFLTLSKHSKDSIDLNGVLQILENTCTEVDLKRLDDSSSMNELSFVVSFADKTKLVQLKKELMNLDSNLEITFLDNSKIF